MDLLRRCMLAIEQFFIIKILPALSVFIKRNRFALLLIILSGIMYFVLTLYGVTESILSIVEKEIISTSSKGLETQLKTIRELVTLITIIVAAVFGYYKFFKGRTFAPQIDLIADDDIKFLRTSRCLILSCDIKNIGNIRINPLYLSARFHLAEFNDSKLIWRPFHSQNNILDDYYPDMQERNSVKRNALNRLLAVIADTFSFYGSRYYGLLHRPPLYLEPRNRMKVYYSCFLNNVNQSSTDKLLIKVRLKMVDDLYRSWYSVKYYSFTTERKEEE